MKLIFLNILLLYIIVSVVCPALVGRFIKTKLQSDTQFNMSYDDIEIDIWNRTCSMTQVRVGYDNLTRQTLLAATQMKVILRLAQATGFKPVYTVQLIQPVLNTPCRRPEVVKFNALHPSLGALWETFTFPAIDRIDVSDGSVVYYDVDSNDEAYHVSNVQLSIQNLASIEGQSNFLAATANGSATIGDSRLTLEARFTPGPKGQDFDLKAQLLKVNFNLLALYLDLPYGMEGQEQNVSLFTQASAEGNRILGHVNPKLDIIQQASHATLPLSGARAIPFEVKVQESTTMIERIQGTLVEGMKQALGSYLQQYRSIFRHDIQQHLVIPKQEGVRQKAS
jgi:hypothetical protein